MKSPCNPENRYGASKIASSIFEKRSPIILTCIIAISAVGYGMLEDNDLIFGIGIVFAIAGYLLVRRRLRGHIRNNP